MKNKRRKKSKNIIPIEKQNFFEFIKHNLYDENYRLNVYFITLLITTIGIISQFWVYTSKRAYTDYFGISSSLIDGFSIIEIIFNSCFGIFYFSIIMFAIYLENKNTKDIVDIIISYIPMLILVTAINLFVKNDKLSLISIMCVFIFYYLVPLFSIKYKRKIIVLSIFYLILLIIYSFFIVSIFAREYSVDLYLYNVLSVMICIIGMDETYILFFFTIFLKFLIKINLKTLGESILLKINIFFIPLRICIVIFFSVFSIFIINYLDVNFKNKSTFRVINEQDTEKRLIVYENIDKYITFEYKYVKNYKSKEKQSKIRFTNLIIYKDTQEIIKKENIKFKEVDFKDSREISDVKVSTDKNSRKVISYRIGNELILKLWNPLIKKYKENKKDIEKDNFWLENKYSDEEFLENNFKQDNTN